MNRNEMFSDAEEMIEMINTYVCGTNAAKISDPSPTNLPHNRAMSTTSSSEAPAIADPLPLKQLCIWYLS